MDKTPERGGTWWSDNVIGRSIHNIKLQQLVSKQNSARLS